MCEELKNTDFEWVLANTRGLPISFTGRLVAGSVGWYSHQIKEFLANGGVKPGSYAAETGLRAGDVCVFRTVGGNLILHYKLYGIRGVTANTWHTTTCNEWSARDLMGIGIHIPDDVSKAVLGKSVQRID